MLMSNLPLLLPYVRVFDGFMFHNTLGSLVCFRVQRVAYNNNPENNNAVLPRLRFLGRDDVEDCFCRAIVVGLLVLARRCCPL